MMRQTMLLFWALASGILAYVCFQVWSEKHAPLFKKFEILWAEDVANLEASHKLPPAWHHLKELKIVGGTPESKMLLKRVQSPIHLDPEGKFSMEALIVLWQESGKTGALIQYNIEDIENKNTVAEIGRTLILEEGKP